MEFACQPKEALISWIPFSENGGTVVAIAGKKFALMASDTRLSHNEEFILTREQPKFTQLNNYLFVGMSGDWGDAVALTKLLQIRIANYEHDQGKPILPDAAATCLSRTYYEKKASPLPYMVQSLMAGIDRDDSTSVYVFDQIGHKERLPYASIGTGRKIMSSILDTQLILDFEKDNMAVCNSEEHVFTVVKDAFLITSERDKLTGDSLLIQILHPRGEVTEERVMLRLD